jgi:gamma-glutamylcyclotransferase (GGCT)/AIG2-like uncharacterized protein YtfP
VTGQDRLAGTPAGAALFAYGTLQFTEILGVLLGRLPEHRPGAAAGWRAAALDGRVYPGLVRADATVTGRVITGLTDEELRVIDEYESGPYELVRLTLDDGSEGWTYAWTELAAVLPQDWSARDFAAQHLPAFAEACRVWREAFEAAGRSGLGLHRAHDPGGR